MLKQYQDVVTFFLKHSFHQLPVVAENRFTRILEKKKFLKFIHKHNLLEENITDQLNNVLNFLTDQEINKFFEHLAAFSNQDTKLPVFFFDNLIAIKLMPISQFLKKFKEIKELEQEDFFYFLEKESFPVFIFNNQIEVIFKNIEFIKVEKKLFPEEKENSANKLNKFLLQLKSKSLKKVNFFKKRVINQNYFLKVQKHTWQNSILYVVIIISKR